MTSVLPGQPDALGRSLIGLGELAGWYRLVCAVLQVQMSTVGQREVHQVHRFRPLGPGWYGGTSHVRHIVVWAILLGCAC